MQSVSNDMVEERKAQSIGMVRHAHAPPIDLHTLLTLYIVATS